MATTKKGDIISADHFVDIKKVINTEMNRRHGTGSVDAYAGTNWQFSTTPANGVNIESDDGKKIIVPINVINGFSATYSSGSYINGSDITNALSTIADLATKSINATTLTDTGCNASCTGLCYTACYSECKGCSGTCSGTCNTTCSGRCGGTSCKNTCKDTCKSTCTGKCTGCEGSCEGCSGDCDGCEGHCGGCDDGCSSTCTGGCSSCEGSCLVFCYGKTLYDP